MDKLALFGGSFAITAKNKDDYQREKISKKVKKKVISMMEKGEISRSECVKAFEKQFASYIGIKHALAVSNGTSALISAICAVGIGPGDEVIVLSFSFWATSVCVLAMHGIPIFADIDSQTYNMSPKDIENKITPKTKAIEVVHIYGNPANMRAIKVLAEKYRLRVIEDCSHAHGAVYEDKKTGKLGDIGCFSLQAEKLVCAGEGGIITTHDDELYKRMVSLGHYEKLQLIDDPEYSKFGLTGMGYKFRPHPIGIAMAADSLNMLDEVSEIRNHNARKIEEALSVHEAFSCQKVYENAIRQYSYQYIRYHPEHFHQIPFILIVKALREEGVGVTLCGFGKIHKNPLFSMTPIYANGMEIKENLAYERLVYLPVSETLTDTLFICAPRIEKEGTGVEEQYIHAYEKILASGDELKKYEKEKPEYSNYSSEQMDIIKAITRFGKTTKEKQ